jgi:hypothetical protein
MHILLRGMWASSTVHADLHGPMTRHPAPPRVVLVDAPPVVINHFDNFGQRRTRHGHDGLKAAPLFGASVSPSARNARPMRLFE